MRTTSSSMLSHNARLHDLLYSKICQLSIETARGGYNAMNKNLGLVLQGALVSSTRSNEVRATSPIARPDQTNRSFLVAV